MNRNIGLLLMLLYGSCVAQDKYGKEPDTRNPNFLIIIADDAGWNDVGYNGSEIKTPTIDTLAKNGVQLNRFYVNPTCSPSRASLLTGRPASRMGIVAPISGRSEKSLPDSILTLPQVLRKENYQTALFGKWHLGLNPSNGPMAYGFEFSYGFLHGQIDQYTHKYKNGDASWHRNGELINEVGHTTDLIGKETISWLNKQRDSTKPFYIQLAYSAPHFPLQETEEWKRPYEKIIANTSRINFASAMSHMDHNIGMILTELKTLGLNKHTIVIFMSDNGAMQHWYPNTQYKGKFKPNDVLGSNTPLKDWKTSNYEGAIRVPAIISWPERLKQKKTDNYISIIDIMPTVLHLAKVINPPKTIEGNNIWHSLIGNKEMNSEIYIRGHLQESIIKKPWKLIRTRHQDSSTVYELFNLENDPEEINNLALHQQEVFEKLKLKLKDQFSKDVEKINLDIK